MLLINSDLMELGTFLYTQGKRADVASRVAFADRSMSVFIKCFYKMSQLWFPFLFTCLLLGMHIHVRFLYISFLYASLIGTVCVGFPIV